MNSKNKLNYLAALIAIVIWSCSLVVTKVAYTTFPPLTLGALRALIAFVLLFLVIKVSKKEEKVEKGDMKYMVLAGLLGGTLYFAFQNIALNYTSASSAALISGAYPAMTAILEFLIFKLVPSRKKAIGLGVAIIGIYLLSVTGGGESASNPFLGNVLMLLAGVAWSFNNFALKNISSKYSPLTITFYQMLFGSIFFVPFTLLERNQWMMPTAASVSALLFLAVLCSVVAFLLYNFGLRELSASSIIALVNVMPVIGLILGIVFMHDPILLKQIIGGAIVILGVVLSSDSES